MLCIKSQIAHMWRGKKVRWQICLIPRPKPVAVEAGGFLWCNQAKENSVSQVIRLALCWDESVWREAFIRVQHHPHAVIPKT